MLILNRKFSRWMLHVEYPPWLLEQNILESLITHKYTSCKILGKFIK